MTSQESWRPIPGHPQYDVSDLGRVRSRRFKNLRVLKGSVQKSGHVRVQLTNRERYLVHRLVLAAFVGPAPRELAARHLNGDPKDNRLVNLRYGTHSENMRDRVAHGNDPQARRTHCPSGHEYSEANTRVGIQSKNLRPCRKCRTCERLRQAARRAAA